MPDKPLSAKVVLIGDPATGKSSIRNRYLTGHFTSSYKATIGADFYSKTIELSGQDSMSLQIWDTAGQERFRSLGAAFYRGSDAVILCFSIIDRRSFQHIADWYAEFKARCPVDDGQEDELTWICIANKLDLKETVTSEEAVSEEEAQTMLESLLSSHDNAEEDFEDDNLATPRAESTLGSKPPFYDMDSDTTSRGSVGSATIDKLSQYPETVSAMNGDTPIIASIDIKPSTASRHLRTSSRSRHQSSDLSIYHTPAASWIPSPPLPPVEVEPAYEEDVTPLASPFDTPLRPTFDADQTTEGGSSSLAGPPPKRPERGFKLFVTSAKTGYNTSTPFEYCAQHIYDRLVWKEYQRQVHATGVENGFTMLGNVTGGPDRNGPLKVGPTGGQENKGWRCC